MNRRNKFCKFGFEIASISPIDWRIDAGKRYVINGLKRDVNGWRSYFHQVYYNQLLELTVIWNIRT